MADQNEDTAYGDEKHRQMRLIIEIPVGRFRPRVDQKLYENDPVLVVLSPQVASRQRLVPDDQIHEVPLIPIRQVDRVFGNEL